MNKKIKQLQSTASLFECWGWIQSAVSQGIKNSRYTGEVQLPIARLLPDVSRQLLRKFEKISEVNPKCFFVVVRFCALDIILIHSTLSNYLSRKPENRHISNFYKERNNAGRLPTGNIECIQQVLKLQKCTDFRKCTLCRIYISSFITTYKHREVSLG